MMAHAHIGFLGGQTARRIDFGGVREAFHVRPHLMPGRRFFLNCFSYFPDSFLLVFIWVIVVVCLVVFVFWGGKVETRSRIE